MSALDVQIEKIKIKSDGGSSSYYDLQLPDDVVKFITENKYVKTEQLIDCIFQDSFNFGTLFKSVIRGNGCVVGKCKEGNDIEYEMNKVIYCANQIKTKYKNKENF